jgi:hypothetical protein
MLEQWLQAAAEEAGAGGADPSLLGKEAADAVLDLAREAAHGVARPAAPLAAFAAGLAMGRTNGSLSDLQAVVQRISARAEAWPPEQPLA